MCTACTIPPLPIVPTRIRSIPNASRPLAFPRPSGAHTGWRVPAAGSAGIVANLVAHCGEAVVEVAWCTSCLDGNVASPKGRDP